MSDKPVAERLQVKAHSTLAVIGAPAGVDRKIGAEKVRSASAQAHVVLLFVHDRAAFHSSLPETLKKIPKESILWIAYPKLSSKLARDLSRDIIHALAPKHGLDTVSQIAIDDDWSALRLNRVR
jgi:hypothetical protein